MNIIDSSTLVNDRRSSPLWEECRSKINYYVALGEKNNVDPLILAARDVPQVADFVKLFAGGRSWEAISGTYYADGGGNANTKILPTGYFGTSLAENYKVFARHTAATVFVQARRDIFYEILVGYFKRNMNVLSLGSGSAIVELSAYKDAGSGTLLGVDVDPEATEKARQNAKILGLDASLTTANALDYKVEKDEFDYIVSVGFLGNYVPRPVLDEKIKNLQAAAKSGVLIDLLYTNEQEEDFVNMLNKILHIPINQADKPSLQLYPKDEVYELVERLNPKATVWDYHYGCVAEL